MGVRRTLKPRAYGIGNGSINLAPRPIIAQRSPTTKDVAELGTIWVNPLVNTTWTITSVVAGVANWATSPAGGTGIFASVEVTGGAGTVFQIDAGNATMAGDLTVAGDTTTGTLHAGNATFTGTLNFSSASEIILTSTVNSAPSIFLHANGGTSEQILIESSQGTGLTSIDLNSVAGGVNIASGLANAAAIAVSANAGGVEVNSALQLLLASSQAAATAIEIQASDAAGGVSVDAGTGGIDLDTTGAFSIDGATASNVTVTGAAADLSLVATGGSVNMNASEAVADAIVIEATDAAGGLQLKAGTGGILIGDEADTTTIDVGNFAPSAARTITIAGGNQAQNDSVLILDGAPSANTQTFEVLSGTATGGTQALNLGNGIGGALTINMGNGANSTAQTINIADGASAANSTVNILSGAGSAGAGVLAMGSNARVTTVGIANVAPAAARITTINGGNSAQSDTVSILNGNPSAGTQTVNILSGAASGGTQALNLGAGASAKTISIGTGAAVANTIAIGGTGANVITVGNTQTAGSVAIGTAMTSGTVSIGGTGAAVGNFDLAPGTGAQAVTLANGTGGKTLSIATGAGNNIVGLGSTSGTSATTINSGSGAINLVSGGLVTTQFGTDTQASPTATATASTNFGQAIFTGFTTASSAAQIFTIVNTLVTTSSALLVTVANLGTNDAQMTMTRVKPAAGSFTVDTINNGAAALNGNVIITFHLLA